MPGRPKTKDKSDDDEPVANLPAEPTKEDPKGSVLRIDTAVSTCQDGRMPRQLRIE